MTKEDCIFYHEGDRDCPPLCSVIETILRESPTSGPYYYNINCEKCRAYLNHHETMEKLIKEALNKMKEGESE